MSGDDPTRLKPGDEVRATGGRYEGRTGFVTKILKGDAGQQSSDALVLVTFDGGATDYCLMSYLERVEAPGSSREKGGKK